MKVEIIERRPNELLQREEVLAKIKFEGGTPSRKEVREKLAKALGKSPDALFIRKIENEYGLTEAKVFAMAYYDRRIALMIEPEHIIRRNEGGGEKSEA